MKIWFSLFAVLFFAGVTNAQAPQKSPNVPLDNPAYADLDFLADNGFRCYPPPPLDQRIAMTRYEFAVMVAVLCRFPSDLNNSLSRNKSHYEKSIQSAISKLNPQQLAAAARLFAQFKPELKEVGIADEKIQFAQRELDFRIKLDSDVPLDNPAYTDMYFLINSQTDGICFYGGTQLWSRGVSRVSFAAAAAGYCGLRNEANYKVAIRNALSFKNPQELAATARLFAQFKADIQELGIAKEQIQFAQNELAARTGSTPSLKPIIAAPFPDVPKTHWAFDAVERLRQSGIIIGNPDGAFAK